MTICAQPGHGVEENHDGVVGARLPVADHKSGQIDGEKSRGMRLRWRSAKTTSALIGHERRMQTLRQYEPVEHQGNDSAAGKTNDTAEDGVAQRKSPAACDQL